MEKDDDLPSFWWCGHLPSSRSSQPYHAFIMTYKINAAVHATLSMSISDGTKAWSVSQTSEQMLSRSAVTIVNVVEEVVRLLESGDMSCMQVRPTESDSGALRVVVKDADGREIGRTALAAKDEIPLYAFVATLMRFLEYTGTQSVDAANDLQSETEGREGASKMMKEELQKRESFNAEIASQMRLLLVQKHDHYKK